MIEATEAGAGVEELTRWAVAESIPIALEHDGEPRARLLPFADYRG